MSSSSPPTPLSRSTSFYSAVEGDVSTAASSPVQTRPCPYRSTKPLPRELKDHVQIFLEEQLYTCAVQLLGSVLAAGASSSHTKGPNTKRPVPVPPASHLALLATLAVHPTYTSRARSSAESAASSQALAYLRGLVAVAGPVGADVRAAVQFRRGLGRHAPAGWRSHGDNSDASGPGEDSDGDRLGNGNDITGRLANEGSVWTRGQDFWSVLGWAMNCSVSHANRWAHWRPWLDLMLDVMEKDWDERERLDAEATEAAATTSADDGQQAPPAVTTARRESIVVMYLDQQAGRRGSFKTVIKALLADGGALSQAAFREVFDKETRGRRGDAGSALSPGSRKRKRREALDLDNDKFGDYFGDEDEDGCASSGPSEPPTPQKNRRHPTGPSQEEDESLVGVDHPGLVESIPLRLRVFRLVSQATQAVGRRGDLDELYAEFAGALKLAPFPLFSLVISQRSNPLPAEAHITLLKELLSLLAPASHRKPGKVDPEGEAAGALTPTMLRECFAPHPANTVAPDDNARFSLVTEAALQLLWLCGAAGGDDLAEAIEKGVQAREAKTSTRRKRAAKADGDSDEARALGVLANSGERLRLLLQVV